MEMTFQQYIDNPMGKKNAVFSQRGMFKQLYTEKFDKVFLREAGKINYTLYIDKKKDQYYIHVKVPSETVKEFYYDVVIQFYTNDAAKRSSPSLQDYFVRFYSNDPAFVFTYLHVFLKNDLFIEALKPKASKLAIKNAAKEKNPFGTPGYVKIIYFAFLFMKSKNLFAKHLYNAGASIYSSKKLLDAVEHSDKKIADRQEAGEKQAKELKKEKAKQDHEKIKRTTVDSSSDNIKTSSLVGKVKSVGRTGLVKKSATTKKTKKIK